MSEWGGIRNPFWFWLVQVRIADEITWTEMAQTQSIKSGGSSKL